MVIPTLDAYTYELFRVIQSMDLYPVTAEGKVCKNEEEFTEWLRVRLSDPKTTGTIGRLLTMVRA